MEKHLIVKEFPTVLQPVEIEYVKLRAGYPSVKDLHENEVKSACAEILAIADFDMSSFREKPSQQDTQKQAQVLKFQTEAFFKEIRGKFRQFTIPELKEAFRRGVRGEAGQYFGLCPKTYHQFMEWYFELEERVTAWNKYLNSGEQDQEQKPIKFSPAQWREFALAAFNNYKLDPDRDSPNKGYSASIYDAINDLIGVEIPHSKRGTVKTLVADPVTRKELQISTKIEYQDFKNNAVKSGLVKKEDCAQFDQGPLYGRLLKKNYLLYFFDQLLKEGRTLDLPTPYPNHLD
jgi:hypothetical protein